MKTERKREREEKKKKKKRKKNYTQEEQVKKKKSPPPPPPRKKKKKKKKKKRGKKACTDFKPGSSSPFSHRSQVMDKLKWCSVYQHERKMERFSPSPNDAHNLPVKARLQCCAPCRLNTVVAVAQIELSQCFMRFRLDVIVWRFGDGAHPFRLKKKWVLKMSECLRQGQEDRYADLGTEKEKVTQVDHRQRFRERESERASERERERDRQTDRQRQTDRHIDI